MSRRFALALVVAALLGCGREAGPAHPIAADEVETKAGLAEGVANRAAFSAPAAPEDQATQYLPGGGLTISPANSMIIRTGQAFLQVDSLEPALALVRQLALRTGGFVANSNIQSGSGQVRSATLELKIPADRYDEALSGLGGVGKLLSSSTTAQDVGEEYVDITARMENAHRLEERLLGLLASRTGKLSDVLTVERELARVREEIERYEGRLRYLKSHADVSTLAITVSEPAPIVGPGPSPIAQAARQAWRNFVGVVAGGIAALGTVVPFLVLGGGVVLVWRRRRMAMAGR